MAAEDLPGIRWGVFFFAFRHIALVLCLVQTSAVILTMRYSLAQSSGPRYIKTTAVVMSELLKIVASIGLLAFERRNGTGSTLAHLYNEMVVQWRQALLLGIPAGLYTLQNNLLFVALQNLDGATYQVTYQLKIFTTAIFSITMLGRKISADKWVALLMLAAGVATVQIGAQGTKEAPIEGQNTAVGLTAVIAACCTSGFAGVYFEKILKGTKQSVWLRNIQLAFFSIILGTIGAYYNDGGKIAQGGFFQGYNAVVWFVVALQGCGGLVIAAVIKYADNLLKTFATSLSIITVGAISWAFMGFEITNHFLLGALLVINATFLYGGYNPLRLLFPAKPTQVKTVLPVQTPPGKR
mmetsp:Transcript_31825/g.83392  ORF Transcript_31825/g.83392 Transcript_31825/m.83392 type:complete len:353 (+) Transcript_31825:276-1334(+)